MSFFYFPEAQKIKRKRLYASQYGSFKTFTDLAALPLTQRTGWTLVTVDGNGKDVLKLSISAGQTQIATTLLSSGTYQRDFNRQTSIMSVDNTGATSLHYSVKTDGTRRIFQ